MKKILLLLLIIVNSALYAQKIKYYEYWFDDNYSEKTSQNLSPMETVFDLQINEALDNYATGVHSFHFRAKDSLGKWSIVQSQLFYKPPVQISQLSSNRLILYEYWFDDNYSLKNTGILTNSVFLLKDTLNLESFASGVHSFHFRSKDSLGRWSIVQNQLFYKPPVQASQLSSNRLIYYEYWFDNDYSAKDTSTLTNSIFLLKDTINLESFASGVHSFHFRAKDSVGKWSIVQNQLFYKPPVQASQLTSNRLIYYEYWFDNDYSAKDTSTLTNSVFLLKDTLNLESFTSGVHSFHFRAKDSLGKWSIVQNQLFYKPPVQASQLTSNPLIMYEYWFDNDYSVKDTSTLTNSVFLLKDTINLESFASGVHSFHFRAKDSVGKWSIVQNQLFYKAPKNNDTLISNSISKYEYWFDDSASKKIIVNVPANTPVLKIDSIPTTSIYCNNHTISIRFQDSIGRWSIVRNDTFKLDFDCNPKAGFNYIQFGNEITFLDTSKNATKWLWDFGDKKKDSIESPKHVYDTVGVITVKLKASNQCGIDSITGQVSITGLQTYSPLKGGNSGKVTMLLYGVGFTDSTVVKLLDSTQPTIKEIIPEELIWNSNNRNVLKAIFNLNNKPIGVWDIYLDKLNDKTNKIFRKSKAFTIELGEKPDPYIDIVGNSRIRRGVAQTYNVTFGNRANIDASGTIFYIAVQGDSTLDVSFDFDFAKPDSILKYDSLPQYFTPAKLNGKPFTGRIYPVYIPLIQANSNFSAKMKVKTNNNFTISGWANPPMFSENLSQIAYRKEDEIQGSAGSDVAGCIVDYAMGKANDAIDEALDVLPGYTCVNTYIESWRDIYNYNSENYIFDKPSGVFVNLLWNISKITADCIVDFVPAGKYKKIADFVKKTVEFATEVQEGFEDGQNIAKCASAFTKLAIQELPPIIAVNSFDPNEKCGPGSGETAKWARSDKEFSYSILYENKASATAAAQVVTIYDTLSKANLDLSTFQLKTFECGNITRYVPQGLKEYSTDVDLRPNKNLILRINGKLDTITGIAKWEYISLDPNTKSLTDSVDLGFLNPNLNPPEGEGKVTYSVRPKKNLSNNIEIRNKAQILFDANEPILTNDWKIRIDNNKAQSAVTALKPITFDSTFVVDWSSNDAVGDVLMTILFVSTNYGPYYLWSQNVDTTSSVFKGKFGSTYKFYSIAVDYAGNIEGTKTNYDSYTTIKKLLPPVLVMPENNQQYVNYKPSFDWDDAEYAESYDIQVSDISNFSNIVYEMSNVAISEISMTDDSLNYLTDYYWRARTVNGTVKSGWSEIFKFKTQDEPIKVPDSWKYEDSTGKNAIVKIPADSKPKIGNRDILNGDAIGFFFARNDSLICAGYNIWNSEDIEVTVWGDDINTTIKDGYLNNEKFRIFIWDAQQNEQKETIVTCSTGNDFFVDGGYSVLSSLITNVTQEIIFSPGWNMVSSYLQLETPKLETLLVDNISNIVIMKNNYGSVFIPQWEINEIENWNTLEGYQIYITKADTFKLTGTPVISENTPIPLTSGWNMPSYIKNVPMDAEPAFASIADDGNLIIAKNNNGAVYIPMFGINDIGNLIPGQGYQIYVSNEDSLIYPANFLGKSSSNIRINKPKYSLPKYKNTGSNSTLIIKIESVDGSEIGVYNFKNEIVGSGVVFNNIAVITIWGDDSQTSATDGAISNSELRIMNYELKTGMISDVQLSEIKDVISNKSESELTYSKDKFLIANAVVKSNSEISLNIKPNPANDIIEIEFTTPNCKNTEISIYSIDGKLIDKILNLSDNSTTYNVSKFNPGEYTVIMTCGNEKAMRKVVVVR
jgi:PKD repeat protein